MTAQEVLQALRGRHPAVSRNRGMAPAFDAWTVVEEWEDIDLLAISAHRHPPRGAQRKSDYPRVGYEVKVSRSDLRRELLAPWKRQKGLRLCHEFYFAVPAGLLKEDELAYEEPDWEPGDFERKRCSGGCHPARNILWNYRQRGFKAGQHVLADALAGWVLCPQCSGKGYGERSRVEREAPTLWVPRDVGLVQVDGAGCHVTAKSPVRQPDPLPDYLLANLVRWVSARPDERHAGVPGEQREHAKRIRERRR